MILIDKFVQNTSKSSIISKHCFFGSAITWLKIIQTLQARSASTHFCGVVMGSNADFMEISLKPKEFVYRSSRAEPNMGMKPS